MYNNETEEYVIESNSDIVQLDESIVIEETYEIQQDEETVVEIESIESEYATIEAQEETITIGMQEVSELSNNAILFLEKYFGDKGDSNVTFESDNW